MKPILLLVAMGFFVAPPANGQQRTFYDASGRPVGKSATDSQGTTTTYDAAGRVIARESKSGNTTTIYDPSGKVIGRTSSTPR